ncbi:hypothetical protein TNCV_818381 [Trichonephila clavipes]|nr:hypothetical protein TNCV_818381 [Trichonephila clavipes]
MNWRSPRFKSHKICAGCFGERQIAARLHHSGNTQQLKQMMIEEWALLPQVLFDNLLLSMETQCGVITAVFYSFCNSLNIFGRDLTSLVVSSVYILLPSSTMTDLSISLDALLSPRLFTRVNPTNAVLCLGLGTRMAYEIGLDMSEQPLLHNETATHIGIREAEDWFRPIDLAKECDIYISSRSGSHKEIPITYGYTQDPFKNRSQNFKPKIKEIPNILKEKIKIALYAVIHLIAQETVRSVLNLKNLMTTSIIE